MAAAKPPSDQQVPPGSSEETLKYQTWVLKVLIHCDGCTKRVKKILQGIEETIDAAVAIPKEIIMPPQPQVLQQQHGYNPYQPHMYYSHPPITPTPPPYGLSYNTSYPVSTTSSYYVGAPVMPMHANYANYPPPPPPSHPINNYGHHNDHEEYEGGYCSIM
ncbi:hypothetical protein TSUD_341930 [Trifolium subterraneum]|nr:hypothetical protein TSUD_341930 [Trifolium subterraneum]